MIKYCAKRYDSSFPRIICAAVILLFSLHISCATAYPSDQTTQVSVYPVASDRYLINPGKGWIVYASLDQLSDAVWEKASVGYARFIWRDIHINDNEFNWNPIDKSLDICVKRGKRFSFGIMPICMNSKDNRQGMPDWLTKAGVKSYGSSDFKIPMWDDPVFISKMEQLVTAMGKRYNGNPSIEFIDCRSFGNWGEWHLGGIGGQLPSLDTKRKLIDQYACFDKTHIIIPVSGKNPHEYIFYARDKYGFGARDDSSEHQPYWKTCLPFLNYGPAIGEYSFPYSKIKDGLGWTRIKWRDEMLAGQIVGSRYSYQPLGEWNSTRESDAALFLSEKEALVNEWQNKMGYWFRMTKAIYPHDLANGSTGTISFTIRNDGVAPIYIKGKTGVVKASLLNERNQVIASTLLKGINPFEWKPNQEIVNTATISFSNSNEAKKIAIGVFSKEDRPHPDIRLGIENETSDNWYVLTEMPTQIPIK